MLVICLLVFPLVDWFTRVNLLTGELTEGLYASYTVAAPCSFGCWDDTPANGQAVLCGPHSDSCHKRQTVYCGPNSDPFIQAPMFGYLYQNPLTIYLAFNFGNIFKIPFNIHYQPQRDGIWLIWWQKEASSLVKQERCQGLKGNSREWENEHNRFVGWSWFNSMHMEVT